MPMSDSGWAEWRRFSAAMLALVGAFNAAEGLVMLYGGGAIGVQRDRMMLVGPRVWGEVSVALGGLLLMLGVWLWIVTVRVRLAAVAPAVVAHGTAQIGILAAYPIWALLMVAFDVVIVFALTVTPAGAARFGGPDVADSPDDYRPRHLLTPVTATVVISPLPWLSPAAALPTGATALPAGATVGRAVVPVRAIGRIPWAGVASPRPVEGTAALAPRSPAGADEPPALVRPWVRATGETMAGTMAGAGARSLPARGAAPILGAISGRCPDTPLQV